MDELSFTLSSPITEEEWDMIADVDFEHTESILFHTKHGKEVEFVKRKKGKWETEIIKDVCGYNHAIYACSACGEMSDDEFDFCPRCGCQMER